MSEFGRRQPGNRFAFSRVSIVATTQQGLMVMAKPLMQHSYSRKKDRFDIRLKRFSLKKKWVRSELLDNLLATLDKKSIRRKRKGATRNPIKETRIEEVGD